MFSKYNRFEISVSISLLLQNLSLLYETVCAIFLSRRFKVVAINGKGTGKAVPNASDIEHLLPVIPKIPKVKLYIEMTNRGPFLRCFLLVDGS